MSALLFFGGFVVWFWGKAASCRRTPSISDALFIIIDNVVSSAGEGGWCLECADMSALLFFGGFVVWFWVKATSCRRTPWNSVFRAC